VNGTKLVGGLAGSCSVGSFVSCVKNSYFTGSVNGTSNVGGIIGIDASNSMFSGTDVYDTMPNCHYNIDDVSINGGHHITMGGLFDAQYRDWFSNDLSLDISDYSDFLSPSGGWYEISKVQGLRDLLGFAHAADYGFRLASDLDLSNDSGLYIPYLKAVFDGDNHTISNLNLNLSFGACLGMFGFNDAGTIMNLGILGGRIEGRSCSGGLVGGLFLGAAVNNSYATGNVNGTGDGVGGLVGFVTGSGTVNNSYATGNVNGTGDQVGGLVGFNFGMVNNSHATGNVSGARGVGGLVGVSSIAGVGRATFIQDTIINSYATGNVNGNSSVGGLAGSCYVGPVIDSYATGNVKGNTGVGGLVGNLLDGTVSNSHATGNVNGNGDAGGLVGSCSGKNYSSKVSSSYATGSVTGDHDVGGLLGRLAPNRAKTGSSVNNSYATGNVTGDRDVGGLAGFNNYSLLSNSYSSGNVTGTGENSGGLVGLNANGTVSNSFWDNETSGQKTSDGGLGRPTALMKTQSTFTDAGWDFADIWCMVENITYPLLTWQLAILPKANAGPDQTVPERTLVTLDGSSSTDGVGMANYTWGFDDGTGNTTLYGVAPSHTFTVPGVYSVTLNISDAFGRWDCDTMTVTVNEKARPVADAGPDQTVDEGTLVTFNGSGSSGSTDIVNYTWTFTDAVPVALFGVQPKHLFERPGTFVVMLNVTDAIGKWDNAAMTVTVNVMPGPVADAGPDQTVDEGTLVTFNGSGSSGSTGIVNYTWTFTEAFPVILCGARPEHRFDDPGTFVVTLNVTDAKGNWDIDLMTVTVNDTTAPSADAGPDQTVDEGTSVTFDGSASTDNVGIVSHSWDFMDGAPKTLYGVRPTYRFDGPGIFVVTLNVTDAAANRDTDTMTVTVIDVTAPVADAGPDRIVDEGTLVAFDASGSSDNVGVVDCTWTFNDGAPVTLDGARPTYEFENPGIFLVTLNAADAAGNRGTDTTTVTVKDITTPVADAGPDLLVDEGTPVIFNGSNSSDNVGIVNYTWTFDYGTRTVVLYGVSPSFTFNIPGVYQVIVNVSDAAGSWRQDALTLVVRDITPPVANAGPDRKVLAGSSVAMNGSLSTDNLGIERFYWNFTYTGKALSLEGENVSFKFDRPGVYEIVLTVLDAAGNRGEDRVIVTVEPSLNENNGGLVGLLWMPVLLIAVAGIAGFAVLRKRKSPGDGPPSGEERAK